MKKKKKGKAGKMAGRSVTLANAPFTCRNCGFSYEGLKPTCPKCGTRQGELF